MWTTNIINYKRIASFFSWWLQLQIDSMVAEKRQLPIRLFTRGTEPAPRKSMNYHSHMEKMDKVFSKLGMDAWLNLRNSCLGVFVTFYEKKFVFAGRIVQHLLLRQLVVEQPH